MMATSTGLRFVMREPRFLVPGKGTEHKEAQKAQEMIVPTQLSCASCASSVPFSSCRIHPSPRERIRSKLNSNGLRAVRDSAFKVEVRSASGSRPELFAFPSGIRIVDASVDILGKETH